MEEAKKTVDLNGSYSFKTDAKGRVSLPAKFRKVLSDDLVVTSALSGDYLMVFDGQGLRGPLRRWLQSRHPAASEAAQCAEGQCI